MFTYRTGLSLSDQIASQSGRSNGPLLNGTGLLETVGVDTTEQLLRDFHTIEGLDGFIPVGVDVGI